MNIYNTSLCGIIKDIPGSINVLKSYNINVYKTKGNTKTI
jgi:regulator of cell morphogenesis and NO signaling